MLTAREKHTLALILDTLIPSLPAEGEDNSPLFRLKASDLHIPDQFEQAIYQVCDDAAIRDLRLFLRGIENGLLNRLLTGQRQPFSRLSAEDRAALLLAWGNSNHTAMRRAFQAVKRLGLALFYAAMPDGQPNPVWAAIGYSGPPGAGEARPQIRPLEINAPTTLYTDVLVIGSGAGGGVVAGELTAAGLDVIVAEKGGYYHEGDFDGREMANTERLYERRGVLTSADLGVSILAGSALGGGTVINWSASLQTPDYVLREWARDYGFSAAVGDDYQQSMAAVMQRIHVNSDESAANPQNVALESGCRKLGYETAVIPRNVRGCEDCGFCNYGCPFGAKQSTLKTYLQDAYERGARIIVRARVERVLHRHGAAYGAELTVTQADGTRIPVTVQARAVVVAAGALHTPVILLRSGLGSAHIGANLHFHPTTVVYSRFAQPMIGWQGAPMTRVLQQFADLDGRGYGVWLETAPMHPGMAAQVFLWRSGEDHKRNMQRLAHFANIIILPRAAHGGRVMVGQDGEPKIHYKLHPYDGRHMMRGLAEALKIHHAAGAEVIYGPHQRLGGCGDGFNGGFDQFMKAVTAAGHPANDMALFSAHQMSTCRIGGSSALGAVTPAGETYEVRNLFVADGSVLPTAAGVNPMLTIMTLAHHIAQHVKSRF